MFGQYKVIIIKYIIISIKNLHFGEITLKGGFCIMLIYVSSNLIYIREELSRRGYSVINNDNYLPCDVIICNLKNGGLSNMNLQSNVKTEGTLIIDSGSKTIDEIENIINNRVYSSLF